MSLQLYRTTAVASLPDVRWPVPVGAGLVGNVRDSAHIVGQRRSPCLRVTALSSPWQCGWASHWRRLHGPRSPGDGGKYLFTGFVGANGPLEAFPDKHLWLLSFYINLPIGGIAMIALLVALRLPPSARR